MSNTPTAKTDLPPEKISTEEKILLAAKDVFMRKGYAGTRMQEVADAAGINKAMLHYYFRSKEKLFRVILTEATEIIAPMLVRAISSEKSVMDKIEDLVRGYIAILKERPYLPLFVVHELSQNQGAFMRETLQKDTQQPAMLGFIQQVIEEGEAGTIRKVNPLTLVMNTMSMVVFPYVARPMIEVMTDTQGITFDMLMADRAEEIIDFIHRSLQP